MSDKKRKILLVEDDSMIVEMYKLRFEEEGFEVTVTEKGSEAIELANSLKPDIILLDIILPEVDGFNILQSLKSEEKTKSLPILMLTNLAQESDKEKAISMGANDYLVKSQHTPSDVLQKVKEIIK
ncbi:MAG: response regulator [Patescibacteria group bacterium]